MIENMLQLSTDDVPFGYRALSDLIMGTFIIAPFVYIIESLNLLPTTLSGLLQRIALPGPVILLVMGLLWTLAVALCNSTGAGWTW